MGEYTLPELVDLLIESISKHSERWILSDTIRGFELASYAPPKVSVEPAGGPPPASTAPTILMQWCAGCPTTLHVYALGTHITELKSELREKLWETLNTLQRDYQTPRLRDALANLNILG